jgi:hypothetical protein
VIGPFEIASARLLMVDASIYEQRAGVAEFAITALRHSDGSERPVRFVSTVNLGELQIAGEDERGRLQMRVSASGEFTIQDQERASLFAGTWTVSSADTLVSLRDHIVDELQGHAVLEGEGQGDYAGRSIRGKLTTEVLGRDASGLGIFAIRCAGAIE